MRQIEWSLQASDDLGDIADYYGQFDPLLPERLITGIYEAALPLMENPKLGAPIAYSNRRKWNARKTPFKLIYEVRGEIIFIVRVVHGMSDWKPLV
jgi:plasmid stabilization system protein ParE